MNLDRVLGNVALAKILHLGGTPGPWTVNPNYPFGGVHDQDGRTINHSRYVESPSGTICQTGNRTRNVEFIAGVRGLLPDLIADIEALMNPDEILADLNKLRAAIAAHHRQKADDRCVEDDDRLYAAAGLPPCDRRVGDKAAMLKNCERFIANRCQAGGWPSYVELEAEVVKLRDIIESLEAQLTEAASRLAADGSYG